MQDSLPSVTVQCDTVSVGHAMAQAVGWRPGFVPWSVHLAFMVDKEALGQAFLRLQWFSPGSIIPL
jgi:hypothetical protein